MANVTKEFNQLPIEESRIIDFEVVPLKKLSMTLSVFPSDANDSAADNIYELQFNKILDLKIRIDTVWDLVRSHRAYRKSKYLDSIKGRSGVFSHRVNQERLLHFQVIFGTGQLDIIAEDFSSNLIWEL
jgi:hypothetical protein